MGEVVGGVDAPGVAGARVLRVQDAVQHGVAQVDVGRRHVDLRAQDARAVGELTGAHAREEVEALGHRPVPPRARGAGLGERAPVLADLVGAEVVHVGLAGRDEGDGPLVQLLEVVRGEVQVLAPVEPEPAHVRLDGVDVLLLFLHRVGVVEAQVAAAAELAGDAEVEADRLGVTDVEVAVGLRREAGDDGLHAALAEVGGDDLADEVAALWGSLCLCVHGAEDSTGRRGSRRSGQANWTERLESPSQKPEIGVAMRPSGRGRTQRDEERNEVLDRRVGVPRRRHVAERGQRLDVTRLEGRRHPLVEVLRPVRRRRVQHELAQIRQAVGHEAAADDENALVAERPQPLAQLEQAAGIQRRERELQHGHVRLRIHGDQRHVGAVVQAAARLVRHRALAAGQLGDARGQLGSRRSRVARLVVPVRKAVEVVDERHAGSGRTERERAPASSAPRP